MRFLFTLAALLSFGLGMSQNVPVISAHIQPDSIQIGDRFEYVIDVEKDQVQVVSFPEFRNDGNGIELIKSYPVDTLERNGRIQKLRKRYELVAFDEGNFDLGRAQVLYAGKNITDTLYSSELLRLKVATIEIDTTTQKIHDIKPQKRLPFRFAEVSGYVMWGALGLLLLLALVYVLRRILARTGHRIGDLFKPAPLLPAHVVAIRALEALHNQKLWQNNRHKQYYSGLTDILRNYIAARYTIGAMEMTSDEIIEAMRCAEELPQKSAIDLATILRTADLVKFAKYEPDAEQNESDYLKGYYFVEETKQSDEIAEDPDAMKN